MAIRASTATSGAGSLTCGSTQSRNFRLGRALGAGEARPGGTVEGVATARAACELAARHGVELPIAAAVADVLAGTLTVEGAMAALIGGDDYGLLLTCPERDADALARLVADETGTTLTRIGTITPPERGRTLILDDGRTAPLDIGSWLHFGGE